MSAGDDLSRRPRHELPMLQRGRVLRLRLAATALACGLAIAVLPVHPLLVIPATALVVGGIIAVPVAAYLLVSVRREIAGRAAAEDDGAAS